MTQVADSDVDVLIVLREGDRKTRWQVLDLGHELAGASDALPSIMVYTKTEWMERERDGSPFYRSVVSDGVRVLQILDDGATTTHVTARCRSRHSRSRHPTGT